MIELVPRSIRAEFKLTGFKSLSTSCRLGLVGVVKPRVRIIEHLVSNVEVLCQARPCSEGWINLSDGVIIKFGSNVLGPKLCPGSVELRIAAEDEGLRSVNLVREPCWSSPPINTVFCRRHFNTRYGRYVRFVYGTAGPDPTNPFFKLPTLLYFIYYGSGVLKVGTTLIVKGLRRFLEQPTYLALIVKLCRGVLEARKLEVGLSRGSRRLSQAPSMHLRTSEVLHSISKGNDLEDALRFACLAIESVNEAVGRGAVNYDLINSLSKSLNIIKLKYGSESTDELLRNALVATRAAEAEELLRSRELIFRGVRHGFTVFEDRVNCDKVLIPYNLLRDRLLMAEELRYG